MEGCWMMKKLLTKCKDGAINQKKSRRQIFSQASIKSDVWHSIHRREFAFYWTDPSMMEGNEALCDGKCFSMFNNFSK